VCRGVRGGPSARKLLIQSPRVTAFLELRDRMIGDGKPFVLGQAFFQAAYHLARAPQCVGDRVPKHFTSCHARCEHIENESASRYILCG
jgi:hypothetical protein